MVKELSNGWEVPDDEYDDPVRLAQFIGNRLCGTASNEPDEVMEIDGVADALDDVCQWCTQCGWWWEPEEMVISNWGELICAECEKDNEQSD